MPKIKEIAHIVKGLEESNLFYETINAIISEMQDKGLNVEIHYQQSHNLFSALILGRQVIFEI